MFDFFKKKKNNDFQIHRKVKVGLALGGGGARGIAHIGAIKAFEELGISPQTFGGSSVGSIIATLLAVGYTGEEIKQIFLKINFTAFKINHTVIKKRKSTGRR